MHRSLLAVPTQVALIVSLACRSRPVDTAHVVQHPDTEAVLHHGDTTITIVRLPTSIAVADTDSQLVRNVAPDAALLVHLAATAPLLSPETIFVYSREQETNWRYRGTPLDTSYYPLFQPYYQDLSFHHRDFAAISVVGRILVDSVKTAFLLRVPGMYSSSAIDLWLYDRAARRFWVPLQLAEHWGDEGFVSDLSAWLVRQGRVVAIIQRKLQSNADMETGQVKSESDSLWTLAIGRDHYGPMLLSTDSTMGRVFDPEQWWQRAHPH